MGAHDGFVIIKRGSGKRDMRRFFTPVDKGSARPAFCYPRRIDDMRREVSSMQRNIDQGNIEPTRKMVYEQELKKRVGRLADLDHSKAKAAEIIDADRDGWKKRRDSLAEYIASETPTKNDERLKRVNPHTILRAEKEGLKGQMPLGEAKQEYKIISRAFQAAGEFEESNTGFLQKEK